MAGFDASVVTECPSSACSPESPASALSVYWPPFYGSFALVPFIVQRLPRDLAQPVIGKGEKDGAQTFRGLVGRRCRIELERQLAETAGLRETLPHRQPRVTYVHWLRGVTSEEE